MAVRAARRRLWAGGALLTVLVTWVGWQPSHTVTFTHNVAVSPRHLWEHVADFNNIAALSPLITEFDLGEESGSYQDWRYTVTYREKMATLPLVGHATSTFRVRPVGDRFEIEGQHRFCYMMLLCSRATNVMEFSASGRGASATRLTEWITYECPLGLGGLCKRETETGRRKFMHDLQVSLEA